MNKKQKKSHPDGSKSKVAAVQNNAATLLAGEMDFPRGAAFSATTKLEDPISMDVDSNLFNNGDINQDVEAVIEHQEEMLVGTKRKSAQRLPVETKKKMKSFNGVPSLKFKNLCVGMFLMGAVKEIHDLELVISLPNNLTGSVAITEISDEISRELELIAGSEDDENDEDQQEKPLPKLSELFREGQLVITLISDISGNEENKNESKKRRIELSMVPSKIYGTLPASDIAPGYMIQASIKSIEDHGYTVNFGIEGIVGFLHKSNAAKYRSAELKVGELIQCVVTSLTSDNRVATVSVDPNDLKRSILKDDADVNLSSIRPGCLVNSKVSQIHDSGLWVKFLGFFEGSTSWQHVYEQKLKAFKKKEESIDIGSMFSEGDKLRSRVLFAYPASKDAKFRIGLSSKPNILNFAPFDFGAVKEGKILENCVIRKMESSLGLFASSQDFETTSSPLGFVHISKLADKNLDQIDSKKFGVGSKHRARIIGLDRLDGMLLLSMQKSVLNARFFLYEDIKVGQIIPNATVIKYDPVYRHLLVELCEESGIKAICHKTHFADVPALAHPEQRFKPGTKVKVRVLSIDAEKKKVSVTLKKTLINSPFPIISSIVDARKTLQETNGEVWCHGVVGAIKPFGLIINFFNNIKGLAHISTLSEDHVEDPSLLYKPGQIVKCRILQINDEDRLKLSLIGRNVAEKVNGSSLALKNYSAGVIIANARVKHVDVNSHSLLLETDDGAPLFMTTSHFSDFPSLNSVFEANVKEGEIVKELLVLRQERRKFGKGNTADVLCVSHKNSLISASQKPSIIKFPFQIEEINVGDVLNGAIQRVDDSFGIFVAFGESVHALCMKHNVSDSFVKKLSERFSVGDSVTTLVTQIDKETQKVTISMKKSDIMGALGSDEAKKQSLQHAKSYFDALDSLQLIVKSLPGVPSGIEVGQILDAKISQDLSGIGAIVEVNENLKGFVTAEQFDGSVPATGSKVKAIIIDIDCVKGIVDLSCRKSLIKAASKRSSKQSNSTSGNATVLLTKPNYAVLALDSSASVIGAALLTEEGKLTVNQKVSVHASAQIQKGRSVFLLQNEPKVAATKTVNIKAIDPHVKQLSDIQVGMVVKCMIKSIKENQMNVTLTKESKEPGYRSAPIFGRIHITEVIDNMEDIPEQNKSQNVFKALGFKQGSTIDAKVIGLHDAKTHKWLPISHLSGTRNVVELTVRPSELKKNNTLELHRVTDVSDLKVGTVYLGFVQQLINQPSRYSMWVQLGTTTRARVPYLETSSDPEVLASLDKHFPAGKAVCCRIISVDVEKNHTLVSIRSGSNDGATVESINDISCGSILTGRLYKADNMNGAHVQLSSINPSLTGRICLTNLSDEYAEDPASMYRTGDYLRCMVTSVSQEPLKIDLSTRPSDLSSDAPPVVDRKIQEVGDVCQGDLVRGYVKNISDGGCFVSIGQNVVARVRIANISDMFIKDWKNIVKVGQLVRGRIMAIDEASERVEMSLKLSDVDPENFKSKAVQGKLTIDLLQPGFLVTGTVVRVEQYGVFVEIDGTAGGKSLQRPLRGLCHRSEVCDDEVDDVVSTYAVGDRVKARVLEVDDEKKQISLGMKSSYFEDEETAEDSNQEESADEMEVDEGDESDSVDQTGSESEEESETEENSVPLVQNLNSTVQNLKPLDIQDSFDWGAEWKTMDVENDNDGIDSAVPDNSSDESESEKDSPAKKSKREKAKMKRDLEQRIAQREAALASGQLSVPETAEDFNRLLLASPNSSFLWIQFMAFYVNLADFDKAREVAERALKTMNFREEQEKFNVWIAYMNLENSFGSPESLEAVFQRAVSYNEPKHVYLALAKIYGKSEKHELAEETFQKAIKKFRSSCKVWVQTATYFYLNGSHEKARQIVQQAVQALPKRKHIKAITKFAQMEFNHGDPERGRTIFEGILSNFPKRVDLWSVYLDMEIKVKSFDTCRRLFERVISMKFSSKKMKFFFKKYLDFEKKHGDSDKVNHVVEAARAYVASLTECSGNTEE